eukprot:1305935-Amphidinium_carterae.1
MNCGWNPHVCCSGVLNLQGKPNNAVSLNFSTQDYVTCVCGSKDVLSTLVYIRSEHQTLQLQAGVGISDD